MLDRFRVRPFLKCRFQTFDLLRGRNSFEKRASRYSSGFSTATVIIGFLLEQGHVSIGYDFLVIFHLHKNRPRFQHDMGFPKVNDQMRLADPKAKTATSEDQ